MKLVYDRFDYKRNQPYPNLWSKEITDYYDVQDGDTPSILAYQVYGDANKHWVILLFNNIINPYYDWPLGRQAFFAFVNKRGMLSLIVLLPVAVCISIS